MEVFPTQSQVSSAGIVHVSSKHPATSLGDLATKKLGLPPFEPPKANYETKPTLAGSEKSEVSSPANQNCGTKPIASVVDPEHREHESNANMSWLGVEFIESAEAEAFIQSLMRATGKTYFRIPLNPCQTRKRRNNCSGSRTSCW